MERLESYTPAWLLPKIFRLTANGKLIEGIFEGETINTPSMLAVEDYLVALTWAQGVGGLAGLSGLQELFLTATGVTDLAPLAGLTGLDIRQ